jgi:hypothetical protein
MTLATEPNAITAHELLLLMAGRVSDAPLAQARSLLAGGSAKQAVSLLADVLAAAPIALEPAELAAVMDLSGAAVPLPDLGTVDEQSPAPFGFSPFDEFGEVARDDLDAAVIAAVQQQSEGVTGLWRSWRYLIAEVQVGNSGGWPSAVPASAAGFASPFRVYLVHVDDPEKANDLARAVLDAAGDPRRTGVEIVGLAKEPPLYQEAALAQSRLLWASAANPEFTVARVYDFAELASGPGFHADHPIVDDPAERKLISAYLHAGRAVLMTTATSDDIVDPGAGAVVPGSFRTDGEWIWTDAVSYYLTEHRLAPDAELMAHIYARLTDADAALEVDDAIAARAVDFLLNPAPASPESDRPADARTEILG